MASSIRIFESDQAARDASSKLGGAGFRAQKAFLPSELAGGEEAAVQAAVKEDLIPGGNAAACVRTLKAGYPFVAVNAPFGTGEAALAILADVGGTLLPPAPTRDAAPLSEGIGIPTLTKFVAMSDLLPSSWNFSCGFGLPLISKRAAPFSSLLGLPTVPATKTPKRTLPSGKPTIGFATLLPQKGPWTSSLGLPLSSKNPAPFSSLFGMPTLT